MARQEPSHNRPAVKDGDEDCDASERLEQSAIVSCRRTFDCGAQTPDANYGRNSTLLTDNGSSTPGDRGWDLSAQQNFVLHGLASGVQTFNVHWRDGKIAAKLHFLMKRVSATSICLDMKLCVRGNDLSISSCSISKSFLLNQIHLPRMPFQDIFNQKLQQKYPPLLQWDNHDPKRQKGRHEDEFVHENEKEMVQLKYEVIDATKVKKKNNKLQQELSYKSMLITSLEAEVHNLKEKLAQQNHDLKVCHDQVLELKGNIRVFCRCRPLTPDEVSAGDKSVIEFNGVHNNELYVHTHEGVRKPFKFDYVFTPSHNQEGVFQETAPLVVSVLDGFNVCIFAYGQTGTGKTFTMEGSKDNRGVNYRTLEKLFQLASERKGQCTYDISVSVLEVYNEEIRDLLAPSPLSGQSGKNRLEIKRAAEGTHHLPGVVETTVHSIEDVWKVLQIGSKARVVGCTNANKHSSRSHCMLCVTVKGDNSFTQECTKSKLWLIDLAGSERIGKTDVQGDRLKEAQNINKSLSALGDVVHALASKSSHIPYRNSKITHLLQDSLGGQSKTLMFVQISPTDQDVGETLCSLNFATRVRGVELGVARKQLDPTELLKYKKLAEKAKQDGFLKDETIKELQDATKLKEQTCKALSAKAKEKENLFEAEKKARSMAEDKLKEQHTLIEKQKQMIEKLSAEIKAKQSGLLQEPVGQKITPGLKASTPRRPPLQEMLTDNVPESNQRLKKRTAEGYEQKENTCGQAHADILPSKTLPRRASMSTIPHHWASTPVAIPSLSGPLPKRRALQRSVQEDAPEETSTQRIVSRRHGRASLCVLPQRQPSSWAVVAPPSPLVKFADPKRRPSMVCPTAPSSVDARASLPAAMILSPAIGHKPSVLREPQKILFRSPLQSNPGTQEYNTNSHVEINDSNAIRREGELQGMLKARRVSNINIAHRKPPQHPHQAVNRELQYQPKRLISQAGEEVDDRLTKMRRLSMVPPLPWERLPPTPTTPSGVPISGNAQRILGLENQRTNTAAHMSIASSLPWEKQQQLWGAAAATSAHMPMLGGAQRVLLADKKSGFARREVSNQRERGWNRSQISKGHHSFT